MDLPFRLVNLYDLYNDKLPFRNSLNKQVILIRDHVLVVGDLNLTLNVGEVWGEVARTNPLVDFFVDLFEELNMIDVEPHKVVPTWRNLRCGKVIILNTLLGSWLVKIC